MGHGRIETRTILWAAGVEASPAGRWLGAQTDRAGRVKVEPDLSPPGRAHVFVISDTVLRVDDERKPLPGVAPVTKQRGAFAARAIAARAAGHSVPPFRYRDYGMLATIGRSHAMAELGRLKLSGLAAGLLWCFAHIYFLIGNRLVVMTNWAWNFVTFQRGARLITGIVGAQMKDLQQEAASTRDARGVA